MDRKWRTLLVACTATFMLLLDITIVNVALPDIQKDLHSSFSDLQWVVDAYALALASLLLCAGSLGDIVGLGPALRRRGARLPARAPPRLRPVRCPGGNPR